MKPAARDIPYLRAAATNPTGRTFISFTSEVFLKAKQAGWMIPTIYAHVAQITEKGKAALKAVEEME
ncbi:MAG: hypothetical protein DI589_12130 [Shinella sp.]|nr:MAG: hypothetical protein DI589_12130 [Shinella sp.]